MAKKDTPTEGKKYRLVNSRLRGSEFANTVHMATPESGTPYERVLEPGFWALTAKEIKEFDEIKVVPEDKAFYAHLLVVGVAGMDVHVKEIAFKQFDDIKSSDVSIDGFLIKWSGPVAKHRVIRESDNHVMVETLSTKEDCRRWIAEYLKAQAA